jgi:cytochrome c oxidase subunit 3
LAPQHRVASAHEHIVYDQLNPIDQQRVNTFFSIYFMMTGLHGLHVLIGMALITWVLIRSSKGVFGPSYFTPVDLVGLYWHLVDLIWIFLFPLLYLIH